jgi:hypothetical protein
MASASHRRKNVTRSNLSAEISQLLQHGAGIEPVTPNLKAAAEQLSRLGLISFEERQFVRCAFTRDKDFTRSNRTCTGRSTLKSVLDENAFDYRCDECGRVLYPFRDRKTQFREIRATVFPSGVTQYVSKLLRTSDAAAVDGVPDAWRVNGGLTGLHICIADFCSDAKLMSVQWAQQNPTCYIAVNPAAVQRFIDIDWVSRVMLADLVTSKVDLRDVLRGLANSTNCRNMPPLATPTFSKGAHRPEVERPPTEGRNHLFIVELGKKTVRVNGIDVVAGQGHTAHAIVKCLAMSFSQDLFAGADADRYLCQTPSDIADEVSRDGDGGKVIGDDHIRRSINRLQENIQERLRLAGIAVERDDVIQASPDEAKEGYRLNPFSVGLRPLLPTNPKN